MTVDVTPRGPDEDASVRRDRVNGWLATINPITKRLVAERTSYSSQLIPVTPYVMVSCVEAFLRYPDVVATITAAMEPEEIGKEARRPGCWIVPTRCWISGPEPHGPTGAATTCTPPR